MLWNLAFSLFVGDAELLYAAAPVCLRNEDVAFRIDGKRMTMGKGARLMSGTAETAQDFTG